MQSLFKKNFVRYLWMVREKTCTATVLFLLIKSENWIEIARAMTKLDVNHMFCIANLRNKIRLFPIREGLLKGFQCLRTSTVNHKCCKSSPYINESCARYLHRSIAIVLVWAYARCTVLNYMVFWPTMSHFQFTLHGIPDDVLTLFYQRQGYIFSKCKRINIKLPRPRNCSINIATYISPCNELLALKIQIFWASVICSKWAEVLLSSMIVLALCIDFLVISVSSIQVILKFWKILEM